MVPRCLSSRWQLVSFWWLCFSSSIPASTLKNQRDSDLTDPTFTPPLAVSFQGAFRDGSNGMYMSGAYNVNTASKSFIGDS